MLQTSASLVVYQTPAAELQQLLQTLQSAVDVWVLVDNSVDQKQEAEERKQATLACGGIYVPSPTNVGFGGGHNVALSYLRDAGFATRYHLMVNPDIVFDPAILSPLTQVLNERPDVGWVMPQVRSGDGSVQPLCKLLPTPFDLLGRRFVPSFVRRLLGLSQDDYEMKGIADLSSEDVPFLSGCFVFARYDLLQKANGFDSRYFMYMEDVDLSRRFRRYGKLLYWPEVHVIHGHRRGSYHDLRLTLLHIRSAILYFQRWGWFSDRERSALNAQALRSLRNEIRFAHSAERSRAESMVEPRSWNTPHG
ncbi:glycosyltransferase family protein [Terriglobus aquaticus]|uniref:Glycosyltransferase, GT2 family n=1 Tax=Terriglobus aquaticus TaxID=940139 RepID=A0ABW9KPJ1_9BACT|nr:hypothetical protein [Terriglobus aquaticus]